MLYTFQRFFLLPFSYLLGILYLTSQLNALHGFGVIAMKISTFEQALKYLSQVLGVSISVLRKLLGDNRHEAIALANLPEKQILAKYKRLVESIRKVEIQEEFKVSKKFGREIYKETVQYSKNRIHKIIWRKGEKLPSGIRKSDILKHGRILKRGRLRGRYQMFVDTLYELPIDGKLAMKEKRKIREVVFTKGYMETNLSKLKSLKKFIPKTVLKKLAKRKKDKVLKRKLLTKAEARQAAKALNDKFYRQDIFELVSEVFGY